MKLAHSLKHLALVLLVAITFHDGVALGAWAASSHVCMFLETKCPLGGADEESRGAASATPASRVEFLPVSHARQSAKRVSGRHTTTCLPSCSRCDAGMREPANALSVSLRAQTSVIRTTVLRV